MKWIIIYLLIGVLFTTISIKVILDDNENREKLFGYLKRSVISVMAGFCFVALIWPLIVLNTLLHINWRAK